MTTLIDSPLGLLRATARDGALRGLSFAGDRTRELEDQASRSEALGADFDILTTLRDELERYFYGELRAFSIPLGGEGTPFQESVWEALCAIPFGVTTHYEDVATRIGRRDAVRAVAAANGANPIAILVPCHRVIGKDGSLTGYAGGLGRKRKLLDHEQGLFPLAAR